jgi:hypothetical protein
MSREKYTDKLPLEQFKRIEEISHYNYNYYVWFDKDLLLWVSDDDNTTEWYLVIGRSFSYLWCSFCFDDIKVLHLDYPNT